MKYVVDDEILNIAMDVYKSKAWPIGGNINIGMKAALEAVFDHIREATEKVKENAQDEDGCDLLPGDYLIELSEDDCKIMILDSELDELVKSIMRAESLSELKEVTLMNFSSYTRGKSLWL